MTDSTSPDKSHGYEALAETFMRIRNKRIGPAVVREWCHSIPPGSEVLDLGCGSGVPISEVLVEAGFAVHGVDASPTLIRAFQERFPQAQAECCAVEESAFFEKTFGAAIAWGLMFLLPADVQAMAIAKVAKALKPGGRFLFTSPREEIRWKDGMTDEESVSLGALIYEQLLSAQGLTVTGHAVDEGENYYYFCVKA
jgi:2-polyprenyl-3-methyl-5-hydroxy-6-metoxy-1,4-benzoquinol methylase